MNAWMRVIFLSLKFFRVYDFFEEGEIVQDEISNRDQDAFRFLFFNPESFTIVDIFTAKFIRITELIRWLYFL